MFVSIRTKMMFFVICLMAVTMIAIIFITKITFESQITENQQESIHDSLQFVLHIINNEYREFQRYKVDLVQKQPSIMTDICFSVLESVRANYSLYKEGIMTEDEAKRQSLLLINKIRYHNNRYFFAYDKDFVGLAHPESKMVGKIWKGYKDIKQIDAFQHVANRIHEKNTVKTVFFWPEPNHLEPVKQMGVFVRMPEWEWIIGTTMRMGNFELELSRRKQELLKNLKKIFQNMKFAETGHVFIFNSKGEILIHPEITKENFPAIIDKVSGIPIIQRLMEAAIDSEKIMKKDGISTAIIEHSGIAPSLKAYDNSKQLTMTGTGYYKSADWYIAASVSSDEITRPSRQMTIKQTRTILLIMLLGIILTIFFSKKIARPLSILTEYTRTLPDRKPYDNSSHASIQFQSSFPDEVEQLSESFLIMENQLNKKNNELENYREHLEELVKARTTQLNLANEQLQQEIIKHKKTEDALRESRDQAEIASLSKSTFLVNMSHEIRTPMNGIMGLTELTLSSSNLNPEQAHYLEIALESGRNLLNIIDDILDLAKIESGKIELEEDAFDLASIVESSIKMFRFQAINKQVDLNYILDSDLNLNLIGDPFRLRQIVTNLLSNAIKFTSKGRIDLHVRPFDDISDLNEITDSNNMNVGTTTTLLFSVSDTGCGIPESKLESIFESFTQADGSITRKYGGTGLGLSISKRIVALMHGDIWVESEPNEGSCFYFTARLGVSREPSPPIMQTTDEELPHLSRLTILLAEDNEINQIPAKRFLEQKGHRVVCAANGWEVLRIMEKETFDVILMDIQMPEMDGIEATKRIRRASNKSFDSHIPIIALTAHAMKGDRERFLNAEIDDYLSKPWEFSMLEKTLKKVMFEKNRILRNAIKKRPAPYEYRVLEPAKLIDYMRNDLDTCIKMLEVFMEDGPAKLNTLKEAMAKNDLDTAIKAAHSLSGISATLRITRLYDLVIKIEPLLQNGDIENVNNDLPKIDAMFAELMVEINFFLDKDKNERFFQS